LEPDQRHGNRTHRDWQTCRDAGFWQLPDWRWRICSFLSDPNKPAICKLTIRIILLTGASSLAEQRGRGSPAAMRRRLRAATACRAGGAAVTLMKKKPPAWMPAAWSCKVLMRGDQLPIIMKAGISSPKPTGVFSRSSLSRPWRPRLRLRSSLALAGSGAR